MWFQAAHSSRVREWDARKAGGDPEHPCRAGAVQKVGFESAALRAGEERPREVDSHDGNRHDPEHRVERPRESIGEAKAPARGEDIGGESQGKNRDDPIAELPSCPVRPDGQAIERKGEDKEQFGTHTGFLRCSGSVRGFVCDTGIVRDFFLSVKKGTGYLTARSKLFYTFLMYMKSHSVNRVWWRPLIPQGASFVF